jgi:allantoicase
MDGWETARHGAIRRGGVDHCIIKLGGPGIIRGFDIDTNNFTGNFVPAASVDGYYSDKDGTHILNVFDISRYNY